MRSFIGAFKALSKWIPGYASLIAPLEVSIKGLQDQQRIDCTEELTSHFTQRKKALQSRTTITIPKPLGHLVLTVAASPVNSGLGGTLFIQHDTGQHVAGFFSFKLKEHQRNWLRCDLEALAFTAAANCFAPYIFESHHPLQILSNSKPCVEAYNKLCKGHFYASSQISTFLSTLSSFNVTITHLKDSSNQSSNSVSRHPNACDNSPCPICDFMQSTTESVVQLVADSDIFSGTFTILFLSETA